MNRHGKASLVRLTRAGAKLDPVAHADIIVRLHNLGEEVDAVSLVDDAAFLHPCLTLHGMTFWRLSIAARKFLLDEILPRWDDEEILLLANAWVMTLPRAPDAFAPDYRNPDEVTKGIEGFRRSCSLDARELAQVIMQMDRPGPGDESPAEPGMDREPAPLRNLVEALVAETKIGPEYWVFEASEDVVRIMVQRMAERKSEMARTAGKAVASDPDSRFNRARKRLMDFEREVKNQILGEVGNGS